MNPSDLHRQHDNDSSKHQNLEQRVAQIQRFVCKDCGELFDSRFKLDIHFRIRHSVQTMQVQQPKRFVCKDCNRIFDVRARLEVHIRMEHLNQTFLFEKYNREAPTEPISSSLMDRYFMKRSAQRPPGIQIHVCPICGKEFTKVRYLKVHISKHTGMKLHQCHLCSKRFAAIYNLKKHLKRHISGEPPERDGSNKRKKRSSDESNGYSPSNGKMGSLNGGGASNVQNRKCIPNKRTNSHTVNTVGTSQLNVNHELQHQCLICNKKFASSGILKQHTQEHMDEGRLQSKISGKNLRSQDLEGQSTAHKQTLEVRCETCSRTYHCKDCLEKHSRAYVKHKLTCKYCDECFNNQCSLNLHVKKHTNKPCKCGLCGKIFKHKKVLALHIMKSNGLTNVVNVLCCFVRRLH